MGWFIVMEDLEMSDPQALADAEIEARHRRLENVRDPELRKAAYLREIMDELTRLRHEIAARRR